MQFDICSVSIVFQQKYFVIIRVRYLINDSYLMQSASSSNLKWRFFKKKKKYWVSVAVFPEKHFSCKMKQRGVSS